jgi:hypothetical protein
MARPQQHEIRLSQEERDYLERNTSSGEWPPRQVKKALILLKADKNQTNSCTGDQIAREVRCCKATVDKVRKQFAKGDRLQVILDKPRSGRPKIIDGEVEAHIVATACSTPPEGRVRWTLELIAERVVALKYVEECSTMTIYRTLKKMNLSLG